MVNTSQVIGINGEFPGPVLNVTTNWNVVINVKNDLDEPLLLTWLVNAFLVSVTNYSLYFNANLLS